MSKNKWMTQLTSEFGVIAEELNIGLPDPVPTRSPSLNWATGIGGFQPGKISVLYGAESAGKSLLAMMAIADVQKKDKEAIFIWYDAEFSFNLPLFKKIGGDSSRLVIRKTNDPLLIFDHIGGELLEMLQDGAPIRGIVIDSIKSIRYPKEVNMKQTTDQKMGGTGASYLPTALKLVIPVVAQFNLLTFLIQQVTMEMDPMKALANPYRLTEGKALQHAADVMLEITKVETKKGKMEEGETISGAAQQVGHMIRVKIKKNRLGPPMRMAEFTWHYERGVINTDEELFELAKSLGVVYHPMSASTGKPNNMMWQYANNAPIKGEESMLAWIKQSPQNLKDKILSDCFNLKDEKVNEERNKAFEEQDSRSYDERLAALLAIEIKE